MTTSLDQNRLNDVLGRFVGDLGATMAAGGVVVGHRLGLYRALADGPATAERAGRPHRHRPAVRRGVAARARPPAATSSTTPATGAYSMTEEQAFVLADPDGPVYVPGAFVLALGTLRAESRITEAFRTGAGIGWHEHDEDVFVGCEQFFRPGYLANLVPSWIPALDGVEAKLRGGRRVADVGCGLGASTVLLAEAYPASTFVGSDYHDGVDRAGPQARRRRRRGRPDDVRGRDARRTSPGRATTWSRRSTACTTWATRSAPPGTSGRRSPPDGTWLIVEPFAGDTVADNLNPVGPGLLQLLHLPVRAQRAVPDRRVRARRPGRRGRDPPGGRRRPGSPGSAGRPRRRSTSSSRRGRRRDAVGMPSA